jgi:hypothetical protein
MVLFNMAYCFAEYNFEGIEKRLDKGGAKDEQKKGAKTDGRDGLIHRLECGQKSK